VRLTTVRRAYALVLALVVLLLGPLGVHANGIGTVFVMNEGDGTVTVLDGVNHLAVERVRVGAGPRAGAVSTDMRFVWVANRDGGNLSVLDRTTYTVVAGIPLGGKPEGVLFDPDGERVYVTDSAGNAVKVVELSSSSVVQTVPVGKAPIGIAISPDGAQLAVANPGSNTISLLTRGALASVAEVPVGVEPLDVAFAGAAKLFVTVQGGVAVVDTAQRRITQVLTSCAGPREIAVTLDGRDLYVACHDANALAIFDTATGNPIKTLPVGRGPTAVAIAEDNRWAFVTNADDGTLTVINTTTREVKSIAAVGQRPIGVLAAGRPITPVQFRVDVPAVVELPRTGVGRTTEPGRQLGAKIVAGLGLGLAPVAAGMEWLRRRRMRRLRAPGGAKPGQHGGEPPPSAIP